MTDAPDVPEFAVDCTGRWTQYAELEPPVPEYCLHATIDEARSCAHEIRGYFDTASWFRPLTIVTRAAPIDEWVVVETVDPLPSADTEEGD